jgi:hypothetical protein
MFEHWMTFAPTMRRRLGLDAETMMRAHDIVRSTMGDAWIEEQECGSPAKTFADRHPLDGALRGRTADCVLEVLQLAALFGAFRDDPRLGKIIESLRDPDKYQPTVFELEIAWKLRAAGARVSLWPRTPRGREADLAADVNGVEYVIETSGFPSDPLHGVVASFLMAMTNAFQKALNKTELRPIPAMELDIAEVSGEIRSSAYAAVTEAVSHYRDYGGTRLERVYPFGTVVVRPTVPGEGPLGDSHWTSASRLGAAPLARSKILGETNYSIEGESSWLYLCDRSFDSDPYVRLQKKLKKEASQLSGCTDGVIILHADALGPDLFNDRERLTKIIQQFAQQHTSTTGIAIVTQRQKGNGTRGISGHYFALRHTALSPEFWQRVIDVDDRSNVLAELSFLASS